MHPDPHIVLIGLRGSGKSTLGRMLGEQLGKPFTDLDELVSELMGLCGPGAIIDRHGIERFREEESKALAHALEQPAGVLALGGGTPTAPNAAELLNDTRSRVIYLRGLPATLCERLRDADNTDRPPLVGDDPVAEVDTLFGQRDQMYQQIAESVLHIDGISEHAALTALAALANAGV